MDRAAQNVVRRSMSLAQLRPQRSDVSASKIRKSFMDYFCEKNHHLHIRSSPVFSLRDPSLAFVNAGMNQFKDVFLGLVQPASNRVANSQKCIRIGGKHNDLLQVGQDGTHHTFFEMLGNWSFGDYFKKEACAMSWDLLTNVYELPPERLYVTYFGGDKTLGLDADVEVEEIWRQIGVEKSHILPFGVKDNFWEAGGTGPCGVCTEIHYDHIPGRTNAGNLVNQGSCDLTELWNLVFIQYNRDADGTLEKLNKHFVDTGMGFERLVAVLQGKTSNYDTDLFQPLFQAIEKLSRHSGYTGKYDGNAVDVGYRVLADHMRMLTVALSDGMIPNQQNKVRGILRKAFTISEKIFGDKPGMLKELTKHVADTLSDAYPQIEKNLPKVQYLIDCEEELLKSQRNKADVRWEMMKKKFPGMESLDVTETPQLVEGLEYMKKNILDKEKATVTDEDFLILYDTLGVPVNLTQRLALILGLQFDISSFENYEKNVKKTDKEMRNTKFQKELEVVPTHLLSELEKKNIKPTTNYFKHDYRLDNSGKYLFNKQSSTVEAIIVGDKTVEELTAQDVEDGKEVGLVLDRSQLFSEEINQKSDSGTFLIENNVMFNITRVVKRKGFMIHFGNFDGFPSDATVNVHNIGVIEVDEDKRIGLMRNQTGLHLLNAALRDFLPVTGEKFSMVTPEKLSLGFMMYNDKLELNDVKKIEKYVRNFILHGVPVQRKILNHDKFQQCHDIIFIPGEPIIEADIPVIEINSGLDLSRKYCQGAHVLNTSDLKDLVITKLKTLGPGLRGIEAVTGEEALKIRKADVEIQERWRGLSEEISNCDPFNFSQVDELSSKFKQLENDLNNNKKLSFISKSELAKEMENVKKSLKSFRKTFVKKNVENELNKLSETSTKFVVGCVETTPDFYPVDIKAIRSLQKPAMILSKSKGIVHIQCFVPEELVSDDFTAQEWLKNCIAGFGGFGGCKKGQNPKTTYHMSERKLTETQIKEALESASNFAHKNLPT